MYCIHTFYGTDPQNAILYVRTLFVHTASDLPPAKILSYNRANRAVAVLCNHQRAPPKTFDQQMENLQKKIDAKKDSVKEAEKDMKDAKKSGDKK